MNRRSFLKSGALWVPPLFAIGRARGQALTLADQAMVGRTRSAGLAPVTYLLKQGFEGTGFDNGESWTIAESASDGVDADYTSIVLDGSQSMRINPSANQAQAYASFTASADVWGYFLLRLAGLPAGNTRLAYIKGGGNYCGQIIINSSGNILVRSGDSGASTSSGAMSAGTTYHVWCHYVKGTGSNSSFSTGWSTDGTRPTGGATFVEHTTGNATSNGDQWQFGQDEDATITFIVDKLRVNNSLIGDNPE